MSEYLVKSESLSAIADAIRARSGSTGSLSFPDGFANEVAAIPSGDDWRFKAVIERAATEIILPSGLTKIGSYVFYEWRDITKISLPDGITSIGNYAFYIDWSLALTSLPEGLTSIGNSAFKECFSLTTITFKGMPSSIGLDAFKTCNRLTTINVPWAEGAVANAPWGATNATINYNYTGEA